MPRLPGCFAVLSASLIVAAHAEPSTGWTATFPGAHAPALAVPVEDGRHFISVALPGATPEQGKLANTGSPVAATTFVDPVSRLVVFKIEGAAVPVLSLRASAPLGSGFPLQIPGGSRGSTLEWVKQVDGKILPLALLKVHYDEAPPTPGTPLLDGSGNLAAIAYMPASGKDGYALPAEVVKHVVEEVTRDGGVVRARLGLTLLPSNKTAEVARILPDSPASRAQIQVGDLLLEVGGRQVGDYADAVNAFYFLRPSATVRIRLRRASQEITVSLTPEGKGG